MGATDWYEGVGRCPRCGAAHTVSEPLKFFDPDFLSYHTRTFTPGESIHHRSEMNMAELELPSVSESGWWRVRAPRSDGCLDVVPGHFVDCGCGVYLVVVLRFSLEPGTTPIDSPYTHELRDATRIGLLTLGLRDASTFEATDVDFAPPPESFLRLDDERRAVMFEGIADRDLETKSEAIRAHQARYDAELLAFGNEPEHQSRERLHADWLEQCAWQRDTSPRD